MAKQVPDFRATSRAPDIDLQIASKSRERSAKLLRPVGYEHLLRGNCRLDGDTGYVSHESSQFD
jgi:hypothetical protein